MNTPKNLSSDAALVKEAVQAMNVLAPVNQQKSEEWRRAMDEVASRYADCFLNIWSDRVRNGEKLSALFLNHEAELAGFGVHDEHLNDVIKAALTLVMKRVLSGGRSESLDHLRRATKGEIDDTFTQN